MRYLDSKTTLQPLALALLAACVLTFAQPCSAATPNVIGYQGRVLVGGVPFAGPNGNFRFALVDTVTTAIVWNSTVGASSAAPTADISIPVSNGLYSVLIGNTANGSPIMAALPATIFTNNNPLALRVYFSDTGAATQALTPDQTIAAVGYAVVAGTAAPNGAAGGDLTGTYPNPTVATVGGVTAANVASGANAANAATSANTAGTIVKRDGSGNFSAGTITASLTGNVTGNSSGSAATFTGNLGGDVTGTQSATTVASVGGVSAANVASGANAANAATIGNAQNTIVKRDVNGDFGAGTVTAVRSFVLGPTTNITSGVIGQNGQPDGSVLIHSYGPGANNSNSNFFAGINSGNFSMTGLANVAIGDTALVSNTTGANNVSIGTFSLVNNTTGNANTVVGSLSTYTNTTGTLNCAFGTNTLRNNSTGSGNVALGYGTLLRVTTGNNNIGIGNANGSGGGDNITTGSNNICIGNAGGPADPGYIRIGTSGTHVGVYIQGIYNALTNPSPLTVTIDSNGKLGTMVSSRRYKEDISDMGSVSERIKALRPVTFRYKKPGNNGEKPIQYGLIAEEVAEAFPELAVFNAEGTPETVRYHDLVPMLLNEFQKEHKKVEALTSETAELKTRLARMEKMLDEMQARTAPAKVETK